MWHVICAWWSGLSWSQAGVVGCVGFWLLGLIGWSVECVRLKGRPMAKRR